MAEFQLQSNDLTLYHLLSKLVIGENRCTVYVVGKSHLKDTFTVVDLYPLIGEHRLACISNADLNWNSKNLRVINVTFNATIKMIDIFVEEK